MKLGRDGLQLSPPRSEEARAPANGRRWSARGFFKEKAFLAIHPRFSERGNLAFSRKKRLLMMF
jgi:hypothetical protein